MNSYMYFANKCITALILAILFYGFSYLLGRSVWLDEAALIKSIFHIESILDFFGPLPYYNQAQPGIVSVLMWISSSFSKEVEFMRFSILFFSIAIASPILIVFEKHRAGNTIFIASISCFFFQVGYFLTEIKHYAFEISAVFFTIYLMHSYRSHKNIYILPIIAIASFLGFSTIIPCAIIMAMIAVSAITDKSFFASPKKNSITALLSGIIILISFANMKAISSQQINGFPEVYESKGIIADAEIFKILLLQVYGIGLLIISACCNAIALFAKRDSFLFYLNIFFLLTISTVFAGKILGFYPITSARHIVWLIPISATINALTVIYTLSLTRHLKLIGVFVFSFIIYEFAGVSYEILKQRKVEETDNNGLYGYIAGMPPSLFAVYHVSKYSAEAYLDIDERIKKHRFECIEYADFRKCMSDKGLKDFYLIVSHQPSLTTENLVPVLKNSADNVLTAFSENGCLYNTAYSSMNTQLLKVNCGLSLQPENKYLFTSIASGSQYAVNHLNLIGETDYYRVSDGDPYIVFNLTKPVRPESIDLITFDLSCPDTPNNIPIQIFWRDEPSGFSEANSYHFVAGQGHVSVNTADIRGWIHSDAITEIRIDLGYPIACQSVSIKNLKLGINKTLRSIASIEDLSRNR
ncbi:hypothetical protein HA520_08075 [Azotobacter chroococcum]|uniref:Uncharacterized protein n=1 Tax=Azotobacter chroococcum TaxID=353 RepID=A0AA43Z6C9_9GAMM|nr:hypothetical protein [Azotobacter chroococcum]NHN77247.1 hypothetical protein [Azotobacter chroococcum]